MKECFKNPLFRLYFTDVIREPGDFAPGDDHREQGQTFCKTLPAHFECRDSGVLTRQCWSRKTKLLGLRLSFQCHKFYVLQSEKLHRINNTVWNPHSIYIPCSCGCKP